MTIQLSLVVETNYHNTVCFPVGIYVRPTRRKGDALFYWATWETTPTPPIFWGDRFYIKASMEEIRNNDSYFSWVNLP